LGGNRKSHFSKEIMSEDDFKFIVARAAEHVNDLDTSLDLMMELVKSKDASQVLLDQLEQKEGDAAALLEIAKALLNIVSVLVPLGLRLPAKVA
jgi:hypothetical protein